MMRISDGNIRWLQADRVFPRIIAIGLVVGGVVTAARDTRTSTPPATPAPWRPLFLVTGGVIAFAVIIGPAGLIPAVFAGAVISAFGSREARLRQTIVLGFCVAAVIALLFVGLLRQPMELVVGWP